MPKRVSPKGMREFAKELVLRTRDNPSEPDNLRHQLFYKNLPAIMRWLENQGIDMGDYDRTHKKNFATAFYSTLSSVLSKMVLDGHITYAELNITEEERIKDDATEPEHKVGILFEKQGLHNTLKPIKAGLNISLWSCKGFNSTNALEQLTSRLSSNPWSKMFIISDYDPSGIEIADDLERRCRRLGIQTKFIRIGINPEDIPAERRQPFGADYRVSMSVHFHQRRIEGPAAKVVDDDDTARITPLFRTEPVPELDAGGGGLIQHAYDDKARPPESLRSERSFLPVGVGKHDRAVRTIHLRSPHYPRPTVRRPN